MRSWKEQHIEIIVYTVYDFWNSSIFNVKKGEKKQKTLVFGKKKWYNNGKDEKKWIPTYGGIMINTNKYSFWLAFVACILLCNVHAFAQEDGMGVAVGQDENMEEAMEQPTKGAGVLELSKVSDMKWNDVGVLITSDGSITVSGKGTLPTTVKAMAYGFVTEGDDSQHNTTFGGVIDLDELMNGGATIGGLREGDMLKFYFSDQETLRDLEGNSVLHNSINWSYDSVAASGNQSVEMTVGFNANAVGGRNPYQGSHDGTLNISVYSYKAQGMVAGQPLPGPMGLLASGCMMLWGFRRRRLVK